jgi:hypothetical protein
MFKDLFNFKVKKTLPQAAIFYGICVVVYIVLATAAENWITRGF